MKKLTGLCFILFLCVQSSAQTSNDIIKELNEINQSVASIACSTGKGNIISNRAMNVFLADKSSYLSARGDQSLYTNYVTLNTTNAEIAVNHVFHTASGKDELVKSFLSLGVKASLADGFVTSSQEKSFNKELGLLLGYTILGKPHTSFACRFYQPGTNLEKERNNKLRMDALRASLVQSLASRLKREADDFEKSIALLDTTRNLPGQDAEQARVVARTTFYEQKRQEYAEEFAKQQAEILTKTKNFRTIHAGWTNLSVYLPLTSPKYDVATSYTMNFEERKSFPFEASLMHTRMIESSKVGRLFFSLQAKLNGNNSRNTYQLDKVDRESYRSLGGTDTLHIATLQSKPAYIGNYKRFLTPSLNTRFSYFPPDWHLGLSLMAEKNFGDYDAINLRLGVPVVLINSKRLPALNLEFQFLYLDVTNEIPLSRKNGNNSSLSLAVGIPMSRLIF